MEGVRCWSEEHSFSAWTTTPSNGRAQAINFPFETLEIKTKSQKKKKEHAALFLNAESKGS